jgi:hypothetical protein
LSEPSSATNASFVPSPAVADSASLASAQVAPPQQAGHKRPQISKLSLDSESVMKQIKRSQLCLDSELLFSFLRAPLVVTLKTQRNGRSSARAVLVPNIVSTSGKNNLSQPSTRPLLRRLPLRQLEATIKQLLIRCLSRIKTQTTSYCLIPTYPKAITPKPSSLPLVWTPKLSVDTLLKTSSSPP